MNQQIAQIIGFLALGLVILSFQKNNRLTLLLVMLGGLILFVIQYTLLNAWTGAFMNLIEAGMVYVSFKKETTKWAKSNWWLYIFITLYCLFGLLSYKNITDLLPIIAQAFGAVAVWQTNSKTIRYLMLIPRPLWFIYNLIVGSYAGMITEVLILFSLIIAIVRFDILKLKENN